MERFAKRQHLEPSPSLRYRPISGRRAPILGNGLGGCLGQLRRAAERRPREADGTRDLGSGHSSLQGCLPTGRRSGPADRRRVSSVFGDGQRWRLFRYSTRTQYDRSPVQWRGFPHSRNGSSFANAGKRRILAAADRCTVGRDFRPAELRCLPPLRPAPRCGTR
jgi:hypothetical protein